MSTSEYARVIANNLRRIMYDQNLTQAEVSRNLKISKATLSSWMNGTRTPRMDNIDMLCHYFNVSRTELMEPHDTVQTNAQSKEYYENQELAELAQEIFDNRQLRLLFDEARDADPEDIQTAYGILMALKKKERHEDD